MKKTPKVSVCIVTFNSEKDIGKCLDGIRQQTWPNISVVIVDNASADQTCNVIKNKDINVHLIMNSENKGFAAGQNQAISAVDSDYVLVLNPDVVLQPDYITQLVQKMEEDEGIGSATGCLLRADAHQIMDSSGLLMSWTRRAVDRGAGGPAHLYNSCEEVFGVSGAAGLYRRKMIDHIKINGEFFDESFFAYKEDVDVAWRARKLGWKAIYLPSAKAEHVRNWKDRSSIKKIPLPIRRHSYKNRYLMIIKNESFDWKWWLRLPLILLYECLYNGYMLITDPKVFGVWRTLICQIPTAFRKRKHILKKLSRV
jgi:GT2 family glycosyltransferase